MANGPNDFRDPKVTRNTESSANGVIGRWIGILAGIIILLLLVGWMLGWFANTDAETATVPAEGSTLSGETAPVVDGDVSVDPTAVPANN